MADRLLRAGALIAGAGTALYSVAFQYGYIKGWQAANREQQRAARIASRKVTALAGRRR